MPRKQKKYHYIYKTTNIITERYYIGMHSTDNLEDGYVGSGKRLWYSINKYGRENHVCKILEFLSNKISLKEREVEIVNEELLQDPLCMNISLGGNGFHNINDSSEIHKKRCSIGGRNVHKKYGNEYSRKIGRLGGIKCRENLKNNPEAKKEWIESGCNTKLKKYGSRNSWLGKTHTEETKEKMKKSAKGKHAGKKNSQYNTCWVMRNDLMKPIKIQKEDLEEYLSNGYRQGRK